MKVDRAGGLVVALCAMVGLFGVTQVAGAAVTQGVLQGVSCTSPSACTAVGHSGGANPTALVERWDGSSWQVQTAAIPGAAQSSELDGVSCTSSSACVAVGRYTDNAGTIFTLAERWDGTSWQVEQTIDPSTTDSRLSGVSCTSASACTAVGSYVGSSGLFTLAERWDGSSWATQDTQTPAGRGGPYGQLSGVSCASANACTAVGQGDQSTLIERWAGGTAWSTEPGAPPPVQSYSAPYFAGVSCAGPAWCTAVGAYEPGIAAPGAAYAIGWQGSSWQTESPQNPGTANELRGVSCASPSDCAAVGFSDANALVEHWDGTNWSVQPIPIPAGAQNSQLLAVSCTSTACGGVGSSFDGSAVDTFAEIWGSPVVSTGVATSVTATDAVLTGSVNPMGSATDYRFQYGTSSTYGSQTGAHGIGSDDSPHSVSQPISGLSPNTTYHFRVVAHNALGTSYGSDQTFTTAAATTVPRNTARPKITGRPRPGAVLTCAPGRWSGASSFRYQWLRDGAAIVGANGRTLLVRLRDLGHRIACRVTASNNAGSATATSAAVRVHDHAPHRLSGLTLSPSRFSAAGSGPSVIIRGRLGTRVSFTLSEQATVTFRVQRAIAGRTVNGRCRPLTRSNRGARRCTLYVVLKGSFRWSGTPARNVFRFTGRIDGQALSGGTYRLAARARDTSGDRAAPVRIPFTIT